MDTALLEALAKNWRAIALRGVFAIMLAILAALMPGITLAVLLLLFGGYALVGGVFNVIAAVRHRHGGGPSWTLLLECMAVAKQQTGYDPATTTAKGAGLGAAIGALGGAAAGAVLGAATGSAGTGAAIGAASGATIGAVGGGVYQHRHGKEHYDHAYSNCMMGRGYSVGH